MLGASLRSPGKRRREPRASEIPINSLLRHLAVRTSTGRKLRDALKTSSSKTGLSVDLGKTCKHGLVFAYSEIFGRIRVLL